MDGIRIERVTKRYRRGEQETLALAEVNIDVAPGEFIAIVGPSGCGKSTLLRLVAGLLAPTTGDITVSDRKVNGPVTEVGIVFQSPVLLDWRNTLGNVLFHADIRGLPVDKFRPRAMQLLQQVGLEDFADRYPHELSGGMRQRASIARALLHDPPLLLMDEPFGALDALTREQMRIDIEELWLATTQDGALHHAQRGRGGAARRSGARHAARPGRIEREIVIDLPRPRGLEARRSPRFNEICDEINDMFFRKGILKRAESINTAKEKSA